MKHQGNAEKHFRNIGLILPRLAAYLFIHSKYMEVTWHVV